MLRVPRVALLLETSTEYGRGLLRGVVKYARLHGPWSVYISPGHLEPVLPKANSWAGNGIIARIHSPKMAELIRATGLPVVASSLEEMAWDHHEQDFGEIRTDSPAIARIAAQHLMEQGLPHFAYCGFSACNWSGLREQAFVQCLAAAGFDCHPLHIQYANWLQRPDWIQTSEHERPLIEGWLKSLPKPVGVMACNDACGREVLQACATAGLHVPDDVAVVGVDNDELLCELSEPPLSSVALDLEAAGYEAAMSLEAMMSGQPKPHDTVLVKPVAVVARRSSEVIAQDDPLVVAALRFIKDHAGQPIGVPDVVEELRVCRRTMERRFTRATGRSILSEITRCRLDRAKRLLIETDLPVHRVATSSGFANTRAFNRTFWRAERRTATAFRCQEKAEQATSGRPAKDASIFFAVRAGLSQTGPRFRRRVS
ncbi:MAG TPA: XylR family transcriptional regulator [Terriglobia bacterium]|nr:XylR family transcriptional regulator [Terriglobia bacterium]